MQIDDEQFAQLEERSRLRLTAAEKAEIKKNLGNILAYLDILDSVELQSGEISLPSQTNRFREDQVQPSFPREAMLENAQQHKDGYFQTPKVLE